VLATLIAINCAVSALFASEPNSKTEAPLEVLSPDKYVGKANLGYAAAKEIPEICSKLFCYCGCDMTDSHSSLLDCFTCQHGVDCTICQDEAIIALDLKKQGKSLGQIQQEIDEAFQGQYPWEKASPALQKYKESARASSGTAGDEAKASKNESSLKPPGQSADSLRHRHLGNCCGHNGS
jgi:hypothetical protein